jgi:hypothetical protein
MYPQMKKPVGMLLLFNANSAILQLYHGMIWRKIGFLPYVVW